MVALDPLIGTEPPILGVFWPNLHSKQYAFLMGLVQILRPHLFLRYTPTARDSLKRD